MKKKGMKAMQPNILVKGIEKYGGKYVATRSFKDKNAICSGNTTDEVLTQALKKGIKEPVIFYVPEKGMLHIY